jgi:hypothetical protein
VGSNFDSQMHLTCTCFVLRSSLQCSHWVMGRPFFLISNRGRSVCLHDEDLWPLMQVSHAYFFELMIMVEKRAPRSQKMAAR